MAKPHVAEILLGTAISTPTASIFRFLAPVSGTISRVYLLSDNEPTGAGNAIFDVNVNGVTIFGDPGDRPRILDTEFDGEATGLSAAIVADDEITVDFDEFTGSASAIGDDLLIVIVMAETGATATDAQLRDRTTHTGVQATSTLSDSGFAGLAGDVSSTSASLADATGLSFAVEANKKYAFQAEIMYRSAATTTGINISMNGPASPTRISFARRIFTSPTSAGVEFVVAYDGGSPSASVDSANTDRLIQIHGCFENGANAGTLIVRFATEVGGSQVTLKPGSVIRWNKLN